MEKNEDILLKIEHLKKYYPVKSSSLKRSNGFVKAVDDISFDVKVGETFGIVGESGCGKSTMGKSVIRLIEPTDGKVILDGQDFTALKGKELKKARENIKLIKNICESFINNFDNINTKNLLFTGNTGLGKTFLSISHSIDIDYFFMVFFFLKRSEIKTEK